MLSTQRHFKQRALALVCASLCSGGALAQQNSEHIVAPVMEELLVTARPIADSQAQSIALQRDAVNVISAIAADDIGRFPDHTAAAALARLPAVAVQRDQGQPRYIQVRGAPARWTTVSFDGINVLGAEERIFRFDSVPAAVMDSVAISKTLTPEMSAEALAGQVNIQTYSPLNSEGFSADLDVGYGPMELGDGNQERYSGRLAWGNDTFGAVVALSTYSMEQVTDNNEIAYGEGDTPSLFDFRSYQLERETNSAMGKLEFAPSASHRFVLSSLYTEFLDHELRNMYQLSLADAIAGSAEPNSGELIGVPVQGWLQDGDYENSTFTNTLGGDHWAGEWEIGWRVNYTETESSFKLPIILRNQVDPTEFVSLRYEHSNRGLPQVELYGTTFNAQGVPIMGEATEALNQTGYGFDGLVNYLGDSQTESMTYKLDFARDWQMGSVDAQLKFGVQYDDREAGSPGSSSAFVTVSPLAQAIGLEWNPNQYVTDDPWDTDFDRGFTATYVDNEGLRDHLDTTLAALTDAGLINPDEFISPETQYTVTEEVTSLYAMNTWNWGAHQILIGGRIEQVDIVSSGYLNDGEGSYPVTRRSDDTRFYPSVHWNFDISETLKYRLALVTGSSRPTFSQMRAGASISDAGQSVSGGNPDVETEFAKGLDTALEWYFTDAAVASVNAFYRDVDNVLFDSVATIGDDRYNSDGIDRSAYEYETTRNGDDGKLAGVEFSYQHQWDFLPEPWYGFGMQANIAFLDGEFTTPDGRTTAFPGTSDKVINTSVFYENFGWSIRLNWQWRDAWLDDISPDADGDYYWQDTERLDLSVRYQITEAIGLYMDINNLTDELGIRYQGNENRPVEIEGFGKRYLFGVRASF
ncbi:TonB-dependent receptor [Gilvimarinus algae]|uniref:TonB-dependent receptor n=1 Tax=Gilvimarinus algae TaxID=3058037 RepID=A0ABT8TFR0_9GAMM|nr:TonB-dependent receptor [Gilvimarinus sp. SDUM040014]MDO3381162.1 TonB-dependent receptor [Gilvimarinus sp. SDUM040014]